LLVLVGSFSGVDAAPKLRDPEAIRRAPLQEPTLRRRERLLKIFKQWLATQAPEGMRMLARDQALFSDLVRSYGYATFDSQWPVGDLKDSLLAIAEEMPWMRPSLTSGWRVVQRWEELEPSTPHTPLPVDLMRALCCVFASWRWYRLLVIIWLSFWALLRPGEVCALQSGDLMSDDRGLLVRIKNPKRRAGGARQQYSRIDAEDVRPIILLVVQSLRVGECLWPGSQNTLTRRLRLGLAEVISYPARFSLGSLRAGGATCLFQRWDESVVKLQWRGRWREMRTLAHYVQELSASAIGTRWTPKVATRIQLMAAVIEQVLAEVAVELSR